MKELLNKLFKSESQNDKVAEKKETPRNYLVVMSGVNELGVFDDTVLYVNPVEFKRLEKQNKIRQYIDPDGNVFTLKELDLGDYK